MKTNFIYLLSALIIFSSCIQNHSDDTDINTSNIHLKNKLNSNNGEKIFKYIYFGLGDLESNIELLKYNNDLVKNLDIDNQNYIENTAQNLVNIINLNNPNFFDDFFIKINSGDHLIIEEEIILGATLIRQYISNIDWDLGNSIAHFENYLNENPEILNYNNEELIEFVNNLSNENPEFFENTNTEYSNVELGERRVWNTAYAVYFMVAVHNTFAFTALVKTKFAFDELAPYDTEADLLRTEMLIDQIANNGIE